MCGIVGIYGDQKASEIIRLGLYAQQHRGQEAWGMICSDGQAFSPEFFPYKQEGLVMKERCLATPVYLKGHFGIGHVRYSTQGSNILVNAQPHFAHPKNSNYPRIYLAANGDITNLNSLRETLKTNGIKVETNNDGEVLVKIIGFHYFEEKLEMVAAIRKTMREIHGSFSAVILAQDSLYAFRDLHGFRPLVMGRRADGAIIFASETVALDICGFHYRRQVHRGEIIRIFNEKISKFISSDNKKKKSQCIFELIYFSHPSSKTFDVFVSSFRKKLGWNLAKYSLSLTPLIKAGDNLYTDCLVAAIPDSSNQAALGFANYPKVGQLPFDMPLVRSHYTGRTFIVPAQGLRDFDVIMKFASDRATCQGKSIILVDDSIVRGTTVKKIIKLLKKAGAKSVHLRIVSPKMKFSCHMGIDTHRQSELIASKKNEQQICKLIGADSLIYLPLEILKKTVTECGLNPDHFCYACFDGNYPCPIDDYQIVT